LLRTIEGIYKALHPGGIFSGTILSHKGPATEQEVDSFFWLFASGVVSYANETTAAGILSNAGFSVEACFLKDCSLKSEELPDASGTLVKVVSFVARKPIS
jgi:hypothetical protein